MPSQPQAGPSAAAVTPVGAGRLALLFEEALTAIARLRANQKTVTDANAFRAQMHHLLRKADDDAKATGFDPADTQLAVFAVVALLDESVLNMRDAAWDDWARRPLQDELFGGHMAGEWFFQHVERLLARPDTASLADLLELHHLCLLLGFKGRYGAADRGALHAIAAQLGDRTRRIRGAREEFVPGWRPPNDQVTSHDPWIRRLVVGLAASVVLAVALWGAGTLSLRSAVGMIEVPPPVAPAAATAPSR